MDSYAIIIPESGPIQFHKFQHKNHFIEIEYEQLKSIINNLNNPFTYFDAVKINLASISCVMYCDDEGLIHDDWRDHINIIASSIYGDTIAGDVIIFADHNDGGTYSLSAQSMSKICDYLIKMILKGKMNNA